MTGRAEDRAEAEAGKTVRQDDFLVVPDHHEALVDRETFQQAQDRLARRSKKQANAPAPRAYPLTGLVRCAQCGEPLVGSTRSDKAGSVRRYVCTSYMRWRSCEAFNVSAVALERATIHVMADALRRKLGS